jgi:hypothetical protein
MPPVGIGFGVVPTEARGVLEVMEAKCPVVGAYNEYLHTAKFFCPKVEEC